MLWRLAGVLLAFALGAAFGWVTGSLLRWPVLGALSGAVAAIAIVTLRDAWRARRLRAWLRGAQEKPAPRSTGLWGDLAYRVERLLRMRDVEIAQERDRLQQFLWAIEASPNGVMMLDANDQITWCNSQAADHFGIDPERDRLQRVTNLVRSPAFVAHLQRGQFDEPIVMASPSGRARLSVLLRSYGADSKLVLSQDITERERTDAMRRDFVANASHEIRTPLTVLAGFVETLSTVPLGPAEQPRVLALMRQQTDRIQALVDDLLTLAQLEGSALPVPDRWLAVDPLLTQVLADGQMLSAGRHRIEMAAQPDCEVAGVQSELFSAMGNLVTNAIRYTPTGGAIEIAWRVRGHDGCGEFEVRDTGIGIAREHLPRLTERFYRVDGSRSRETGGTGLGLTIVKHVAQRHGGELDMQSEPGKGSTFRLVLPAARVRASHAHAAPLPVSVTAAAPASSRRDPSVA